MSIVSRDLLLLLAPVLLIVSVSGNIAQMASHGCLVLPFAKVTQSVDIAEEPDTVPPLKVRDLNGGESLLRYDAHTTATVIYVFSPSCVWCERNKHLIKALAARVNPRFSFVGLSTTETGLKESITKEPLGFPVFTSTSRAGLLNFGVSSTPTTMVISPQGRVLRRWKGAYIGTQLKAVDEYFGVRLGALSEVRVPTS